jgi:hypothetical protein
MNRLEAGSERLVQERRKSRKKKRRDAEGAEVAPRRNLREMSG